MVGPLRRSEIMRKIHTRMKRKLKLPRGKNAYKLQHKEKTIRPKTFKTEESANIWAEKHGMVKGSYTLKKVKHNKKFEIVREDGKDQNSTDKENN
jgi:hypothetical protein